MDQDIFDQLDQLERGARALHTSHEPRQEKRPEYSAYNGEIQRRQSQHTYVDADPYIDGDARFDEPVQLDAFGEWAVSDLPELTLSDFTDELLLRQPDQDSRQWQAAQGHARLSLPSAGLQSVARASDSHHALSAPEPALNRPSLSRFAFGHADNTVFGHSDQSSSPAFNASQRRVPHDEAGAAGSTSSTPGVPRPNEGHANSRPSQSPLPQYSAWKSRDNDILPTRRSESVSAAPTSRASHPGPTIVQGIELVSTRELPDRFRAIFKFPVLNAIQSKCFPVVFGTNDNFVLSSPTGSGKTAILELAICRLVHGFSNGSFKIVYMAPTKSLCSERVRDWQARLGTLDLQCAELTGDTDNAQLRNVQHASIIITTPEKWDSITRKWKDHQKLMQMVKLFLIDEVHFLKEDRGPTLEAVVSRMKSVGSDVRFIALSATVPNSQDIATWLGKDPMNPQIPAPQQRFGEEFRPVRLQKHVCGYQSMSNDFAFEKLLDSRLTEIIAKYSQRKPIMVFCMTRKSCVVTARLLADWWSSSKTARDKYWPPPSGRVVVADKDLRDTIASGVAFHHAGLSIEERSAVEKGYLAGELSVICCTSTLAVGVNLPCHMVIIKGTVSFTNGGGVKEYSDLEIMQMLGRAGRPQFDTSAVAVIMTCLPRVAYYETMMAGSEVLESCLHEHLIDHLNAEIGLGTVTNASSAKKWLAGTFLYVRLKENPEHYKLGAEAQGRTLDERLEHICKQGIALLTEHGLVRGTSNLQCSELGDSMARYYIQFDTMKLLLALKPKAKISEILSVVSQAAEFKDIRFRAGEKSFYKELNKNPLMKFPIPVNVDLTAHKVSLIIQSVLGAIDIPTEEVKHRHEYTANKTLIFQHAHRLIRCIIDCQLYLEDSVSVRNALMLARSFGAQVWDDSPLHIKLLEGVGPVGVRKLVAAGVTSIEDLANAEPGRIETAMSRNPPFGREMIQKATTFPQLRISLKAIGDPIIKKGEGVSIKVKADIGLMNEKVPDIFNRKPVYICLLVDTSDGRKAHFARVSAKVLGKGQEVPFSVKLTSHGQVVRGYLMCDEIAGTQRVALLKPEIPAFMFPSVKAQSENSQQPAGNSNASNTPTATKSEAAEDEFGDAGLDDATLAAADYANIEDFDDDGNERQPQKRKTSKPKASVAPPESTQMPNGRWTCNHTCKNKATCRHGACCREGLEKKPRPPRAKETKKNDHPADPRQTQLDLSKGKKQPNATSIKPMPSKESRVLDKPHNTINTSISNVQLLKAPVSRAADASQSKFVSVKQLDSEDFGSSTLDAIDLPSAQDILSTRAVSQNGFAETTHGDNDAEEEMLDTQDEIFADQTVDAILEPTEPWDAEDTSDQYLDYEINTLGVNEPTILPEGSAPEIAHNSTFDIGQNTDSDNDSLAIISGALQDNTITLPTSKRTFEDTAPDDASQFFSDRPKQMKLPAQDPSGLELASAWHTMDMDESQLVAEGSGIVKPEMDIKEEESIEEWFEKNVGMEFFQLV